jgi:hypothetical protein
MVFDRLNVIVNSADKMNNEIQVDSSASVAWNGGRLGKSRCIATFG